MKKNELSYEDAYAELQEITTALELNKLPIDQLSQKVERAGILMNICKNKLREIDSKLDKIFENEE